MLDDVRTTSDETQCPTAHSADIAHGVNICPQATSSPNYQQYKRNLRTVDLAVCDVAVDVRTIEDLGVRVVRAETADLPGKTVRFGVEVTQVSEGGVHEVLRSRTRLGSGQGLGSGFKMRVNARAEKGRTSETFRIWPTVE